MPAGILREILLGYVKNRTEAHVIEHSFNHNNVAFLPEIGYFKRGSDPEKLFLVGPDNSGNTEMEFEPVLKIDGFEIMKHIHPLLHPHFTEFYNGENHELTSPYHSTWKKHTEALEKALYIIKVHIPDFYEKLQFTNKRIYIHDNLKVINFVTLETHGMLYFNTLDSNDEIYFLEELIHQGSHNYLNVVFYNKSEFFKMDVEREIMKDNGGAKVDTRTIYSAFHGLYTVTKRLEYFDLLLSKGIFSGRKKHELLGRLTDQFSRFRTGLGSLDLDRVYTEKGKEFYFHLEELGDSILSKYHLLPQLFDLSNRDVDFRYEEFCLLNPIEKFNEFEAKGQLSF